MCQKQRRLALGWDNKPKDGVFVPDCGSEGAYKPVQCLLSEGPCWCVNENGIEIPGTRAEKGKPADCSGKELLWSGDFLFCRECFPILCSFVYF